MVIQVQSEGVAAETAPARDRWSARRTLAFIIAANLALWGLIGLALGALR